MSIKSLTAEQLYDCLLEAVRQGAGGNRTRLLGFNGGYDARRMQFINKFRAPAAGATEYQSGIPQALTMMNGQMIRQLTSDRNSTLLTTLEAPFFSDKQKVETLFLSTLSRRPTKKERDKFVGYLHGGGATGSRRQALADMLWALVNSAEFTLNH